jgi:hypothetical protein
MGSTGRQPRCPDAGCRCVPGFGGEEKHPHQPVLPPTERAAMTDQLPPAARNLDPTTFTKTRRGEHDGRTPSWSSVSIAFIAGYNGGRGTADREHVGSGAGGSRAGPGAGPASLYDRRPDTPASTAGVHGRRSVNGVRRPQRERLGSSSPIPTGSGRYDPVDGTDH